MGRSGFIGGLVEAEPLNLMIGQIKDLIDLIQEDRRTHHEFDQSKTEIKVQQSRTNNKIKESHRYRKRIMILCQIINCLSKLDKNPKTKTKNKILTHP